MKQPTSIATINSGSSSIKLVLFAPGNDPLQASDMTCTATISGIGQHTTTFHVTDTHHHTILKQNLSAADQNAALKHLLNWFKTQYQPTDLLAIGHRIVQGGKDHHKPQLINPTLLNTLRQNIPFATNHLPAEIQTIQAFQEAFPLVKQIVCFDTNFHWSMPDNARHYALPRQLRKEGVVRYGFHGLSYEFLMNELHQESPTLTNHQKIILAHLGNGASLAAVHNHQPIDTTMGFSPTGGLVMSTRSGDLDPGVLLYLAEQRKMSISIIRKIITHHSGLLGVSDISGDMQELLNNKAPAAAEAINLFCYQARKFIGAMAAAMGGVDRIVFTGGIGEQAPTIRQNICEPLHFLGVHLNKHRNQSNAPIISTDDSPIDIRVIPANEALTIARHARQLIESPSIAQHKHT